MEKRIFTYNRPFVLECGGVLPRIEICYHISREYPHTNEIPDGTRPKPHRSLTEPPQRSDKKTVWICHALTANSDPSEWWDTLVGEGKFFDPRKYTIVCANILGSCYGTTGPASTDPRTGRPYLLDFPRTTIRDIVACHELLREELGIARIDLLIGGSVGGFQALEWSIIRPEIIKTLAILASNARITPWGNAFNESQRMALYSDASFESQEDAGGGSRGLAAARSIALLSYRSYEGYNRSQREEDPDKLFDHKASSYQRYQGEKLRRRFNAYSYLSMLNLTDSHNTGRGRGGVEKALQAIRARTVCIGIDSDILFPYPEQEYIASHVPHGEFHLITSAFGHDGFLLEWKQIQEIIGKAGF